MNRLLQTLSFTAAVAAAALTISATQAQAQDIQTVQGGHTVVTFAPSFVTALTAAKITPASLGGVPITSGQIVFGISSGAINLDNANGQVLHSGGMEFISGKNVVTIESLILSTWNEVPTITGIVVVNGKFQGRITLFDVDLPSDLTLPIAPKDGDFFLSGLALRLDPAGAAALNDAFKVKSLHENDYVGNTLSVVFVPLSADAPPAAN